MVHLVQVFELLMRLIKDLCNEDHFKAFNF